MNQILDQNYYIINDYLPISLVLFFLIVCSVWKEARIYQYYIEFSYYYSLFVVWRKPNKISKRRDKFDKCLLRPKPMFTTNSSHFKDTLHNGK